MAQTAMSRRSIEGEVRMKIAALAAVGVLGASLAVAPMQPAKACGPACVAGAAILGTFAVAAIASSAAAAPYYYAPAPAYYPPPAYPAYSYAPPPAYYPPAYPAYYGAPYAAYAYPYPYYYGGPYVSVGFGHRFYRYGHPVWHRRHF